MPFDKPIIQASNSPYRNDNSNTKVTRTIYYGEVISIDDDTDGGRIKVRIQGLDTRLTNDNLPWSYPLIPKFFHIYPQIGEMVRVFIEDIKYPERSRFWIGSVISQPQKIGFDSTYTALSTTNMGVAMPEPAPVKYPESEGVFPLKTDIAIIGKINTDVILRINEVHIRAGKHENNNILKLNTKNPAEITLAFEKQTNGDTFQSNTVITSDKIALISHIGIPRFKSSGLETKDRERIFAEGHPIARGDVIAQIFDVFRSAIISHIHGYSNIEADKTAIINDLEKLDFTSIFNKNIVIN